MRSDITKRNQCLYLHIAFSGVFSQQKRLKNVHFTGRRLEKSLNYRICDEKPKPKVGSLGLYVATNIAKIFRIEQKYKLI